MSRQVLARLPRARGMIALLGCVAVIACHRAKGATISTPTSGEVAGADSAPSPPNRQPLLRIPRDAARFEIEVVSDSTARFKPREASWIRPGMTAYVVDPTSRDALVARTRIISVWNEMAVAVVTSQVTRVTPRHVVLMMPPPVPWWRTRKFWLGAIAGTVFGGAVGVIATP